MPRPLARLQNQARLDLQRLSDDEFLAQWFFRDVPYAFRASADEFRAWHSRLAAALGITTDALAIGGSAAAGISLAPTKRLRLFGPRSDIDLAVISLEHFESAWSWMREARTSPNLEAIQRELIRDHMTRLVFFETIGCDRNLQEFPFGRDWFAALEAARTHELIGGREIKVRIYRNRAALVAYVKTECSFFGPTSG